MEKDFDEWNKKKKCIHKDITQRFFQAGEIWWVYFGWNVGVEQNGDPFSFKRPVLVLRKFSNNTCLVAPLSTSIYKNPFRINMGNVVQKESCIIVSQMRVLDTRRFIELVTILDGVIFQRIRKTIKDLL